MSPLDRLLSADDGAQLRGRREGPARAGAGSVWLRLHATGLSLLVPAYHGGMAGLALLSFAAGGWLRWLGRGSDECPAAELGGWAGFLRRLGGPTPALAAEDPDARLGPLLCRDDAAGLFRVVGQAARFVGGDFPSQIRLSYLPCCGVLELPDPSRWNALRQVLVIGLPLLSVLSVDELRAVVAHESVHLSRGDAAATRRATRFLALLAGAVHGPALGWLNPLVLYARGYHAVFRGLAAPLARSMEYRADRIAGAAVGSNILAAALLKTALVQALFKELLDYYHPVRCAPKNLYEFFRAFWERLPAAELRRLEGSTLAVRSTGKHDVHPCLADRLARLAELPPRPETDPRPACELIAALNAFETLLHNRIYCERERPIELPKTFHKAGS